MPLSLKVVALRVAVKSARRYAGVDKQPRMPILQSPDSLRVFLDEGYQRPDRDATCIDVVIGSDTIVVHEYSQDRIGDHQEREFRSLQEFVRFEVRKWIEIHERDLTVRWRLQGIAKGIDSPTLEEAIDVGDKLRVQDFNRLEQFFTTRRFEFLRRLGGFPKQQGRARKPKSR